MRKTVNIADDAVELARRAARRNGVSLGEGCRLAPGRVLTASRYTGRRGGRHQLRGADGPPARESASH